ncbi:MAG: hypothetical protein GYA58_04030 [Anaerolineaceae bacterium]|nr:hypothetical protein [Anaerolineaceae bacterium]
MEINTANLIPLSVPVPPVPLLEEALGYTRKARFFATWWQPEGDEAMVSDGIVTATGQWIGYLAYIEHPRIYSELCRYELGASDCPAQFRLVIDRVERKGYVARPADAQKFLARQWPEEATTLNPAQMDQLLEALDRWLAEDRQATIGDVLAWMEANQNAVAALQAWLNETEITTRNTP